MFKYSDNQTVLAWIKSHPNHYNVFVANRITEIQGLTNPENWFYVSTDENPADCASRGIFPSELVNHKLWWYGPEWLSKPEEQWPSHNSSFETELKKRKIPSYTHVAVNIEEQEYMVNVIKKHSTLSRLLWNTGFVTKFCLRSKSMAGKEVEHPTAQNLRIAINNWTRYIQHMAFRNEIVRIKAGDELLVRSKLIKLRPFIDREGLLRVGGRLSKSRLSYEAKHPIILPKDNCFTKLIVLQAYKYTLHGGPTIMSAFLSNYWIFGRSNEIKKVIGSCLTCFPHRSKPSEQIMADLPVNRVTQHRAFLNAGVDFVSSLRADAFIACFKRFVAKNGKCSDLYSDNGKNFVSARRQLREQYVNLMKDPELQSFLAHDGTTHHFNPQLSPSFGRLWEARVKSIKFHLKRLIGSNTFT